MRTGNTILHYEDIETLQELVRKLRKARAKSSYEIGCGVHVHIESLEVFENIAFVMSKHADPDNVPDNPDDFLEQFNTFSIYEILPQLIELWGLNTATQVESKKTSPD